MVGVLTEPLLHFPPRFLQVVEVNFRFRFLPEFPLKLAVVVARGDDEATRGHDHSPVAWEGK